MNRFTALTLASLCAAACSSSSDTKPTAEQYDDTAQAIASQTATSGGGGDVASMSDSVNIALGVMPTGFTVAGDGHFTGKHLGLDYSYDLTCKTATGTVLGVCGPTTDQATVNVHWSGDLTSQYLDASVSRDGSWTVTGLQSSTATFSGDGNFSFDATVRSIFRPGASATYNFDASASYDAIKITTSDRKIIDGSASFDLTAHAMTSGTNNDVNATFDIHAELAFHADHTASLTLDGSQQYTLDLSTGAVVRVTR